MPKKCPRCWVFLPKNRMAKNDSTGINGTSHMYCVRNPSLGTASTPVLAPSAASSKRSITSPLHQRHLVDIDGLPVPVDEDDDRQSDAHLGGRDGDHEQSEDLTRYPLVREPCRERDQIDVD